MFSTVKLSRRRMLLVGLAIGLVTGAALTLFGDTYHDNNLFIPGANAVLELSAKGAASDVRSWKPGKIGVEGAGLFINNSNAPTAINASGGNVGIGTAAPNHKLEIHGTDNSLLNLRMVKETEYHCRLRSCGADSVIRSLVRARINKTAKGA